MTAKKVCITGAAGQTGLQAVKWLSQHKKNLEVCAGTHKGEVGQETILKNLPGVKTCVLEAADPSNLQECFTDTNDVFIIPTAHEDKVQHACNYIDAAKKANVKFVLLLSVVGADRENYSWGKPFQQIEEHLRKSGVENWCILRTSFYAQNIILYKEQVKDGYLPLPTGEGKFAPIDVEDVGEAAGQILADCGPHKGQCYELTGHEALNGREMARIMTEVLGRDVEFRDISPDEARQILESQNVPEVEIKSLLDFCKLAKENTWETPSKDFTKICNRNPRSLHDFCKSHKSGLLGQQ